MQALLLQEVFTSGSQGAFQVHPLLTRTPRGAYTESTAHGVSHTPFQSAQLPFTKLPLWTAQQTYLLSG